MASASQRDVLSLGVTLREEWLDLQRWAATLDDAGWSARSVIDGWTVRDLVTHLAVGMGALIKAEAATPSTRALTPNEWFGFASMFTEGIAEGARQRARDEPDTLDVLATTWAEAEAALERAGEADRVVSVRTLATKWSDLIATRILEVVVHTDDLNRSLPDLQRSPTKDAQRIVVRTLLDMLAERAPGKALEVRVPPFAAVQCVEGPRHTRGTPPNVIETDPWTWIRVACGRIGWHQALSSHAVSASGSRADLSDLLPLL
jgi:uncharacterized protein (TIGR03083 family)